MRMKFVFDVDDDQRMHIDNIFYQRNTKDLATRKDIGKYVGKCLRGLLNLNVHEVDGDPADAVIADINEGGWSFIGEPTTQP